ncbi:hypothetical protein PHYSODRAFT_255384, partial [Phytophthora sojae]
MDRSGHFKADCPVMASDRNPNCEGGPLFRTDTKTAPGAKKAKNAAINTMTAVVTDGKKRLFGEGKTALERALEDQIMDDLRSLDPANQDNSKSAESPLPPNMDEVEEI